MKKVEAIIKPFKLDEVKEELTKIGVSGLTLLNAKGFGNQKGHTSTSYKGSETEIDFMPKLKLEFVISEDKLEIAIETLKKSAYTGRIGDGKIFISNIEQIIRIRTGEIDTKAI